jgi:hypothetical protein
VAAIRISRYGRDLDPVRWQIAILAARVRLTMTVRVTVSDGPVCVTVTVDATVTVAAVEYSYCDAVDDPFCVASAAAAKPAPTMITANTAARTYLSLKRNLLLVDGQLERGRRAVPSPTTSKPESCLRAG